MKQTIVHEQWEEFVDVCPGISISRQQQHAGGVLRPHWHDRIEIWRVLDGHMSIACDREAFQVSQGNVVIFNPFEVHSCMVPDHSLIDCYILDLNRLAGGAGGGLEHAFSEMLCGGIRFCHLIREPAELWPLLEHASDVPARSWDDISATLALYGLFYQMFGRLYAEHIFIREEHRRHAKTDDMSVILNYIHSNYGRRLTLDDLASQVCLSKSYFCRWFKNKIGESPIDYLNTIRIRRAYELLRSTGLSITEISDQTGFSDINCFNRQFKNRMSFSPSWVRRRGLADEGKKENKP